MSCGDRNAEEYPSIATGALATTAVGAGHLTQPRVDSNRLPHATASPADGDRNVAGAPAWVEAVPAADSMTHPEAECAFGLLPIATTMRGDAMWTGRLADGVGCLIVRRPDDVVLRSCGGDAATPGFVSYAAGESELADVYILAPEGAKSFALGDTELPVTGGVAVAYGVDQAAATSELTR